MNTQKLTFLNIQNELEIEILEVSYIMALNCIKSLATNSTEYVQGLYNEK